ncbi:MAG: hypothetical protein KAY37_14635 [Phycisphaerae bacterium]|nr:hypothetical protein [Phycisphaerae bacterium]
MNEAINGYLDAESDLGEAIDRAKETEKLARDAEFRSRVARLAARLAADDCKRAERDRDAILDNLCPEDRAAATVRRIQAAESRL